MGTSQLRAGATTSIATTASSACFIACLLTIAIAQGSSECNISFVIEEKDVKTALLTTHREFGLDASPN